MEQGQASLEKRLERLEGQVRAQRVLLFAALVAGMGLTAGRPAGTQSEGFEVRAPFRVSDARGRIYLEVDAQPRPMQRLSPEGKLESLGDQEPFRSVRVMETRFTLNDSRGRPRVALTAGSDVSTFGIKGADAGDTQPSAGLMVATDGRRVGVFDQTGQTVLLKP